MYNGASKLYHEELDLAYGADMLRCQPEIV